MYTNVTTFIAVEHTGHYIYIFYVCCPFSRHKLGVRDKRMIGLVDMALEEYNNIARLQYTL